MQSFTKSRELHGYLEEILLNELSSRELEKIQQNELSSRELEKIQQNELSSRALDEIQQNGFKKDKKKTSFADYDFGENTPPPTKKNKNHFPVNSKTANSDFWVEVLKVSFLQKHCLRQFLLILVKIEKVKPFSEACNID